MRSRPLVALVLLLVLSLLLGGAALSVLPAVAVRPDVPAAGPAGRATPVVAIAGEPVTVAGRAGRRGRVELQRRAGKRWVRVDRSRTDRTRRYAFRLPAPAATATYRVRAVPGRWVSRRQVVRVIPQAGALTVPGSTRARTVLPVTATFTPARPGRPVRLEARTGTGAWTAAGGGVQDAQGRVVLSVQPAATTSYRAVAEAWRGAVPVTSGAAGVEVQAGGRTPWVTGYYAGWYWDNWYQPQHVDMSAMTHFVFGRVAPGGGSLGGEPGGIELGAVSAQEPYPFPPYDGGTVEDWLVRKAHAAGTEALLMLGGDGYDGRGFVTSTSDAIRPTFVENVVDYLVAHDYDGVDVDWENCFGGSAEDCGEDITPAESHRRLHALLLELRAEMATRPRYADDPGLITFPGYAQAKKWLEPGGKVEQWRADTALLVDQYNLMTYGIGTTWYGESWDSWFSGALDGEDLAGHPFSIDSSIEAYVATGVPRERLGMGIGFYGIYYGPSVTAPRQDLGDNEVYEVDDNALAWSRLTELGYLDRGRAAWDAEASSTYRTYGDGGFVPPGDPAREPAGLLSYEDERSIAAKGAYTHATGLGGTIVWVLNYGALPDGRNPLLGAVKESFLGR